MSEPSGRAGAGAGASFNGLVAGLAASALAGLQQVVSAEGSANQSGTEAGPGLAGVRQVVDMLAVLQEKTRGNLTDEEQQFLDSTVADLKLAFVKATSGTKTG
jgi:Domain of unknown function (DUF1844)